MTREHDDAMKRLNRLGDGEPEPIRIVPATPMPELDDEAATMAMPVEPHDPYSFAPTQATHVHTESRQFVEPEPFGVAPAGAPVAAPLDFPERPNVWPAIIAGLVALVVGGIVGFLIGDSNSVDTQITQESTVASSVPGSDAGAVDQAVVDQRVDDILTLLLAQAQQNGSMVIPTPFPKLDQLLALAPAATTPATTPATSGQGDGQATLDDLTAQRDQLAAQVKTLEDRVASVEAERDALQATIDSSSAGSTDQAARISELEGQLNAVTEDLANAQADLDHANATLDQLNVQQLGNVVGTDIEAVRQTAQTNGWQLIEAPADTNSGAPNKVTSQQPPAGTNMVKGSVLYVEVAKPK